MRKYLIISICLMSFNIFACSIFMYSDGGRTLFANNEDGPVGEKATLTFFPSSKEEYGRFIIKIPNISNPFIAEYPQGGMNEKGLAYDITATPLKKQLELIIPPDTPYCDGNLMDYVLKKAADVDEAVKIILKYKASEKIRRLANVSEFRQMQVLLADRKGNAAVIGIGKDRKLSIIRKDKKFQVLTNFSLAQPDNSVIQERLRYDIARKILNKNGAPSIDLMRSTLSAIHVEGVASTIYSTIYDLNTLDIYLYNFHDFEFVKKINLLDELTSGYHSVGLNSYFKERRIFSIHSMKELVAGINMLQSEIKNTRKKLTDCLKKLEQCK